MRSDGLGKCIGLRRNGGAVEGVMILGGALVLDARADFAARVVAYSLGETPARSIAAPVPAGGIRLCRAASFTCRRLLSSRCSSLPLRRLPPRPERPSQCRLLVSSHDSERRRRRRGDRRGRVLVIHDAGSRPGQPDRGGPRRYRRFLGGELANLGHDYYSAGMVPVSDVVQSSCGQFGPYDNPAAYCPLDDSVYYSVPLGQEIQATVGDYAWITVLPTNGATTCRSFSGSSRS